MRDDATEIARRLEANIPAVLDRYFPGWIKQGNKALLTPKIRPKQKKPTSSFIVNLSGRKSGQWYRFSAGFGGGMTALIFYAEEGHQATSKEDWAKAFNHARKFLGMESREESQEDKEAREARRKREAEARAAQDAKYAAEKARKDAARMLNSDGVWKECIRLQGTHGEAYLVERGIPPISEWPWDCHAVLRFHPSLDFENDWHAGIRPVRRFPAIVGNVQDAFGKTIAIWQIYLKHDVPEKADLDPAPKIGRGPAAGGAVRIGGDAERIGVAEGMETAIALWVLEGFRKPVWSLMSTSGMKSFEPPLNVKHVSIYPDGDRAQIHNEKIIAPPGISAATSLFKRMKLIEVGCNINEMSTLGDGLDLLNTRNHYERSSPRKSSVSETVTAGDPDQRRS